MLTEGRARKVKCDEGKPSCDRCISTGRLCDGYGIWGGGGRSAELPASTQILSSRGSQRHHQLFNFPVSCHTPDEQLYLDWFYIKTAPKIPGMFPHKFWSTLLRQASATEPAVLHATLTLSSAHKTSGDEVVADTMKITGIQKYFLLRSYSKAIRHLQPHLATKDRASARVALIACAVFTCLELLRGNFKTAQAHLQSGLRVLQEYGNGQNGVVMLGAADTTDQLIIEMFQRLHVQVALFHYTHRSPAVIILQHQPSLPPPLARFQTLKQAWDDLILILYQIVALRGTAPPHNLSPSSAINHGTCTTELIPLQQHLQATLHDWHTTYLSSKPLLDPQEPTLVINAIITNFYSLASILCATCLSSELAYDAHTPAFLAILRGSVHLWASRPEGKTCRAGLNMAHSIVDFGWVAPLYYTAIKCRVRRVRLQAVRLLESTLHREGIWDCRIMSRVMRRVMEIEDEELCIGSGGEFALDVVPGAEELEKPGVPLERRLGWIRIGMEDEMVKSVVVEYRRACYRAQWERMDVVFTDLHRD